MYSLKTKQLGFTLTELIMVVVIIGVLGVIAYPAYSRYTARSKRTECKAGVLQVMQQQERYFTQYNTYLAVGTGENNPRIKNFSGDNRNDSACNIASAVCAADQGLSACVKVTAAPNYTDPTGVTGFSLTSSGTQSCAGFADCWKK